MTPPVTTASQAARRATPEPADDGGPAGVLVSADRYDLAELS